MLRPSPLTLPSCRPLAAMLIVIALVVGSSAIVRADSCAGPNEETGSCSLSLRDYPGEYPYAMTVAGTTLYVADLLTGLYYTFDATDITAPGALVPQAGPIGPATYTGLAHNTSDGQLYWLVEGNLGATLVKSNLDGMVDTLTALTPPTAGGFLSGLAYAPDTNSFWTFDILNDQLLSFSADGTFDPAATLASPGTSAFGGASYGLGLTMVPADNLIPTEDFDLHVAVGFPSDLRAQRVERLDPDSPASPAFGISYDLDSSNDLSGWITGLAYNPANNSQFVADADLMRIVEVPSPTLAVGSVTDLVCLAQPNDDVVLTWSLPSLSTYTSVAITRDGEPLTNTTPSTLTFTDPDVAAGAHRYGIRVFTSGGAELPERTCDVIVGFGRLLNARTHDGSGAFAATVIESTGQVLVADLAGGAAHLYPKTLSGAGVALSSPFAGQTSGVAWNATDDTLLWHDGAGQLQKTDLLGNAIGTATTLFPLPAEPTGDISYSAGTGSYYGISISGTEYFEFLETGEIIATCAFPAVDGEAGGFGQGIAVATNTTPVILDAPIGRASGGKTDRVSRLIDCVDSGLFYETVPTTLSGAIAGIAWTPAGSNGFASEYLIGYDTNTIYEVSLDLSSVGDDFQRGDTDGDGSRNLGDAVWLLLYLFNGGELSCLDAGDANDDGTVNTADVITILNFLFQGGIPIAEPLECGSDPSIDAQVCDTYEFCG